MTIHSFPSRQPSRPQNMHALCHPLMGGSGTPAASMRPSSSAQSLGQVPEVSEPENWSWLPTRPKADGMNGSDPDIKVTITDNKRGGTPVGINPSPGKHYKDEELTFWQKRRNLIIWCSLVVCIVVPAVVGPVYYFTVKLPQDRAAVEAARLPPVLPLPPLVPVTELFYDGFDAIEPGSWNYLTGNGLDRGWDFKGFGLDELQCFTPDTTNIAVIPDPKSKNVSSVLRLQAVYHPQAITCMPGQAPFNSTTTSWTSGGITSKSKRIFKAPTTLAAGAAAADPTAAGNCTSLVFEARVQFPAIKGTRASLQLLPEPQDQPANAPRCEWADECGKYGKWPASGDIAIVEHKDTSTSVSHAIQIREYGQHAWRVAETALADTALEWHVYKLEWNCDYLRWYVDDQKVHGVSRFDVAEWPFDQPFFLAITYSVGGRLVDPNVATMNSAMLVDYIRVYPANADPPTSNVVKSAVGTAANNRAAAAAAAAANSSSNSSTPVAAANNSSNSNTTLTVPLPASMEGASPDTPAAFTLSNTSSTSGGQAAPGSGK